MANDDDGAAWIVVWVIIGFVTLGFIVGVSLVVYLRRKLHQFKDKEK